MAMRVQDGVRLAGKVNRKNFGVSFNLCHCLSVGDGEKIPQLLEEARAHLFMVTINGADAGGTTWQQLIQPLGAGTYDVGIVLRKLRQIGYPGPVAFQGFGIQGDRREILSKTMAAWKTHPRHRIAQSNGRSKWYSEFRLEVADIARKTKFARE